MGRKYDSICQGYAHPSASGDVFTTNECFAPGKGLSEIDCTSAWGSFTIRLK